MRVFHVGLIAMGIALLVFVDVWWTAIIRSCLANAIFYPMAVVFNTSLRRYILSSYTIGACFNCLIYFGANFPVIWEIMSKSLLSSSTKIQMIMDCPPGFVLEVNASHVPSSNGCGADDIKIDKQYLPYQDQELCCNSHDVCYDTCHRSRLDARKECDLNFKSCLDNICSAKSWTWTLICPFGFLFPSKKYWDDNCEESLRVDREKKCVAAVEVLFRFVDSLGSSAYGNAQQVACTCIPEDHQYQMGSLTLVGYLIAGVVFILLCVIVISLGKKGII